MKKREVDVLVDIVASEVLAVQIPVQLFRLLCESFEAGGYTEKGTREMVGMLTEFIGRMNDLISMHKRILRVFPLDEEQKQAVLANSKFLDKEVVFAETILVRFQAITGATGISKALTERILKGR